MRQHITVVQSCHRNLGNDHFKESRERREYTKFIGRKAKSSSSGVIPAFHDSRWNEDFGMFLVDDFQSSRTLEVTLRNLVIITSFMQERRTINDHNLFRSLFLAEAIQDYVYGLAKHNSIRANFF